MMNGSNHNLFHAAALDIGIDPLEAEKYRIVDVINFLGARKDLADLAYRASMALNTMARQGEAILSLSSCTPGEPVCFTILIFDNEDSRYNWCLMQLHRAESAKSETMMSMFRKFITQKLN